MFADLDHAHAEVELGEIIDRNVRGFRGLFFRFRSSLRGGDFVGLGGEGFLAGVNHGVNVLVVDSGLQGAVGRDGVIQQRIAEAVESVQRRLQEGFGLGRRGRQDWLQVAGEQAEHVDRQAADVVQLALAAFFLGQLPRRLVSDQCVDGIGLGHGCEQHGVEVAPTVGAVLAQAGFAQPRLRLQVESAGGVAEAGCQPAVEMLVDESGAATGDVDELADQVAVHARREVFEVEVEVIHAARGLGGEVVAQVLGIEAAVEVGTRHDEGAARLRHLGAVHRQVAVDLQAVGQAHAVSVQHRRPEQAVEVDDVLADEMHQLGLVAGLHQCFEVEAFAGRQRLQRGQVADRRVQPDVEELAGRAGDLETEVGRVAGNVPVAQAAVGIQPLAQLGLDAIDRDVTLQPLVQRLGEMRDADKVVLGLTQLRRRTADHRARVDEIGWRIGRAAVLTVVAVLVFGTALRAGALDVAVRQEHGLDRVVELLDRALVDVAAFVQCGVEALGQRSVAGRIGGIVVVEDDVEVDEVLLVRGLDGRNEGFRRGAGLLGRQHDRRAVGVVGADKAHRATHQALRPDPDIGLDIADQMAKVQVAIGVGQGVGDQDFAVAGTHAALIDCCNAALSHVKQGVRSPEKTKAAQGRLCRHAVSATVT